MTEKPVCVVSCTVIHLFVGTAMFYLADLMDTYEIHVILGRFGREGFPDKIAETLTARGIRLHWLDQGTSVGAHRTARRLANDLVQTLRPRFVMTHDDMSVPEIYVARAASRSGIPVICYQTGSAFFRSIRLQASLELKAGIRAQFEKFKERRISSSVAYLLSRIEPYARHFLSYWIVPLLSGSLPFPGPSSLSLRRGVLCQRDGNYLLVYQPEAIDALLEAGVPANAIVSIKPPLMSQKGRAFLDFLSSSKSPGRRTILLMFSQPVSSSSGTLEADMIGNLDGLVRHLAEKYVELDILVKPHPSFINRPNSPFFKWISQVAHEFGNVRSLPAEENAVMHFHSADIVISNPSHALEVARWLGGLTIIVTHFEGPNSFQHLNMKGFHFYEFCAALHDVDIRTLSTCDSPAPPPAASSISVAISNILRDWAENRGVK